MNTAVMFSTGRDDWSTPQDLFDALNAEFRFTIDGAATAENAKCQRWFGPGSVVGRDALLRSWNGEVVWVNPPYSKGIQARFIEKAVDEVTFGACTVVMLLPARTDTRAFHKFIWDASTHHPRTGVEVRFLKGRLKFGGAKAGAPFPSMVVIFRSR